MSPEVAGIEWSLQSSKEHSEKVQRSGFLFPS